LEIPELSEEALALLADEAEDVAHVLTMNWTIYHYFPMTLIRLQIVYKLWRIGAQA
jgi:hypothetical protein